MCLVKYSSSRFEPLDKFAAGDDQFVSRTLFDVRNLYSGGEQTGTSHYALDTVRMQYVQSYERALLSLRVDKKGSKYRTTSTDGD